MDLAATRRVGRLAPRLLLVSILIVTVSTLPVFLTAATVLQMGNDLGFGTAGLGVLVSLFFLTASVASAPMGRLVERIGWHRAMRLNGAGSAAVLISIAVGAHSVPVLAVLLVIGAGLYGLANPAANLALARRADPDRRALVFGLKHAGIPLSTLLSGAAVPTLALTWGWRWAYAGGAGVALLLLLLIPRHPEATPGTPGETVGDSAMPTGRLLLLALGAGFASTGAIALAAFAVAAGVEAGITESSAGILLTVGSLSSITARVVVGHLTDRRGGAGLTGVAALMGLGAIALFAMVEASGPGFALLVVVAFMTSWAWPGLLTYAVVRANEFNPAASTGVTQAGLFGGAGVGPVVIGYVVDRFSYGTAWVVAGIALLVAAGLMLAVSHRPLLHRPAS